MALTMITRMYGMPLVSLPPCALSPGEEAKPTLAVWMVVAIVVAGLIITGSMVFLFVQESKSGAAKAEIDMNEVSRIHKESLAESNDYKGGVEYASCLSPSLYLCRRHLVLVLVRHSVAPSH